MSKFVRLATFGLLLALGVVATAGHASASNRPVCIFVDGHLECY